MATDGLDKEFLENGIKETQDKTAEQTYEKLINEIGTDPSKEKFVDLIKVLYLGFRTASGNEKIYNKMYKELHKSHTEVIKINKTLSDNQREERKELETITQKYNELLRLQLQTKEELKQQEEAHNEFLLQEQVDEPEIDEGLIQDLRINNEQLTSELTETKQRLIEIEVKYEKLEEENTRLQQVQKDLTNDKDELEKKIESNLTLFKKEVEHKEQELLRLKDESLAKKKVFENQTLELEKAKNELTQTKDRMEKTKNTKDFNMEMLTKKENEIKNANKRIQKILEEKEVVSRKEKARCEELKKVQREKDETSKTIQKKEIEIKEIKRKVDINNDKYEEMKLYNDKLKLELKNKDKVIAENRVQIEDIKKERDRANKMREDKELALKKQQQEMDEKLNDIRKLEEEKKIHETNLEKNKQQLNILDKNYRDLERARNKTTEENTKLKNKNDHLHEDIKLGENRVQELEKKVAEYEKKLKQQREVYDAARREKNLYFKNLIETQDDLVERQNLLQFNKKEIENLKSDLKTKDGQIIDIKGKNSKLEKDMKIKEIDNNKLQAELETKSKMCQAQEKEMEKLKINVEETAKNYSKLENEYKKTIIDRDNLSSQLIRRNDEVSVLHEKIMILTTDMSKLEQKIQEKEDSLNNQGRAIQNLSRELKINQKFKEKSEAYSRELININKELLREKNLNKALTEEVEASEKLFHRWRKLEGIDPDSLELHYKISLLQKRLIGKTEECVEKEITIQDLTKELANCKQLANKKPLFEIEESIKKYKEALANQYNKNKAIMNELSLYRNQAEEYKADNNRIKKENVELQNKYHELKIKSNRMAG